MGHGRRVEGMNRDVASRSWSSAGQHQQSRAHVRPTSDAALIGVDRSGRSCTRVRYEERGPAVSGEAKMVRARKVILNCEASAIASNFSQLHRANPS